MDDDKFFSNRELYDLIQETGREMQSLKKEMAETRTLIRDYNQLRQKVEQIDSRINTLMWVVGVAIPAISLLVSLVGR